MCTGLLNDQGWMLCCYSDGLGAGMVAGLSTCVAIYLDMFWASGPMLHQVSPDEPT